MTFFDNMSNFRAFNDLIDSKLEKRFKKKCQFWITYTKITFLTTPYAHFITKEGGLRGKIIFE